MIATGKWGECDWTISEAGELHIGAGLAESVSGDGTYPWDDYREEIRSISFGDSVTGVINLIGAFMNCSALERIDLNGLDTSNTVDMSWMLCGCGRLESIDLSMLETGKVVDMSCMFLSCGQLQKVEFGSIDISSVMDMSKMFMYCGRLKSLDVSTLDNRSLKIADDMFFGCDGLRALVPGSDFSLGGGGRTLITLPEFSSGENALESADADTDTEETRVKASDWRRSVDGVLYVADTDFCFRYDGNGGQPVSADGEQTQIRMEEICSAGTQLRAGRDLFEAPAQRVFKEWNTHADGKGRTIRPGQQFYVHSDMTLYAIWAGRPAFTKVYDIPPVVYGQCLDLPQPEIDGCHGDITSVQVQISDHGTSDWQEFANEEPLPVKRSGASIRYVAENFVGRTVSEARSIRIERAEYDMSEVKWVLPEDLSYDGQMKEVHLEGLPEGLEPEYAGNTATGVGRYRASVLLHYDEENYMAPDPVQDLQWSITKGKYRMDELNWTYLEAFTYDGQEKSIRLEGLPEGTTPYYSGADAVNAGTYVATAGLDYDIDNYSSPDPVRPCTWTILKSSHDMSDVHWEGPQTFVYDGAPKKVELAGLPEGVRVECTGNVAVEAGRYTARAVFVLEDPVNYEIPEPVIYEWEIQKANHNIDQMEWSESGMVYDGTEKSVCLHGIPEGVSVIYEGDTAVNAGFHTVRAEFCVDDLNNYYQMDSITHTWQIRKADIDLSRMHWNYSSPYIYNGSEKSVELRGIPAEIESVSYTGARGVDTGTYTAHAEFVYDTENYNPPFIADCRWSILKANLRLQNLCWNYEEPFVYNGESHTVRITNLPENATVEYESDSAVRAGTYECCAHITPLDTENYNTPQPIIKKWEIQKAVFDISGFRWDVDRSRVFDDEIQSIGILDLPEGVTVSYEGNEAIDAGQYKAKAVFAVEDTANFVPPQPEEVDWTIAPAPIDLSGIGWDYSEPFTHDGSEKEILLKGLPDGVGVRYSGNVASNAGEYSAKAVLLPPEGSSYRETEILGRIWRIEKAEIDVSGAHWVNPDNFFYDGLTKQVYLEDLPSGVHVDYIENEAVDAGSYYAQAILTPYDDDNFIPPKISGCSWHIGRADIDMSDVVWSGYETFVYDGAVHKVVLKNPPEQLEPVYDNNTAVNAGNYIASAEFRPKDQRNYNTPRRMQYEWSIAKAPLDGDSVYWTSGEDDLVYTGKPHSVHLADLPRNAKVEYNGNTAVDAGQYIASAVLVPDDAANFLPYVVDPYRWEISRAEIDITDVMWASSGPLVYDGTLKVVGLTGLSDDISVEYENNMAVNAGTYHASAVLSTHNNNYTAPEIEGCTWTIEKAATDISGVTWSYASEFTYDGYEKSVELQNLPPGLTVRYHGNAAIEAGDYIAEAILVMDDPLNYATPVIAPLEWRIGKRDYDMSRARWVGTEESVYDGTAKTVKLVGLEEGLDPIYQGNSAVDAGVYTASARFLYDEDNYNQPPDLSCNWEIRKAPLDVSGVQWTYEGPFKADRKVHTVQLRTIEPDQGVMGRMFGRSKEEDFIGLPKGTTVRYEGNSARAAGVYEARAYISIPSQPNHEVTEPIRLTWEIVGGK